MVIVGTMPNPTGGISTYIYRYVLENLQDIEAVIDLYPDSPKATIPSLTHMIAPKTKSLRYLWLALTLNKIRGRKIFFNFSTMTSLLYFSILPKRSSWYIMLHHGDLENKFSKLSKFQKKVALKQLARFDHIYHISHKQYLFFQELSLKYGLNLNLIHKTSYIPLDGNFPITSDLPPLAQDFIGAYKYKIIMSGFFRDIYRYELAINFLIKHGVNDFGMAICTYGDTDQDYRDRIISSVPTNSNIVFLSDLSMLEFHCLLKECHLYIRANSVDSFGIAAADAYNLGLKVIASDACIRLPGITTFPTDDNRKFNETMKSILTEIRKTGAPI